MLPFPSLPGEHQLHNAGTAIACIERLTGFKISEEAIRQGLLSARWPGRLQRLMQGPLADILPAGCELWLDGGHNPAGGLALGAMVREWARQDRKPLFLVAAMLKKKDHRRFFAGFDPADVAGCFVTEIPGHTDSESRGILAVAARASGLITKEAEDIATALEKIASWTTEPCRILICGSLYLVGSVLAGNR